MRIKCRKIKSRYFYVIFFVAFCFMFLHCNSPAKALMKSKKCLLKMINEVSKDSFDLYWLTLEERMNECTFWLFQRLPYKKFRNDDETKYGILPYSKSDECNVVTLGIGRDVGAEMELSQKCESCKFFGVDPDAERSGRIYRTMLNGTFIKGLVGAKNGNYNASVLDDLNYKSVKLQHFSFQELLSEKYHSNIIDFLFMDIEGDEFALMEDLIYNPKKYPTICQINVEYHLPFLDNRGLRFFKDLHKSITHGPYFPLNVETKLNFLFNRIFFINLDSNICVNKFLRNYFV